MKSRRQRLARKFRQQETFATGYSPLYARLFGCVAGWLASPPAGEERLVTWLLQASSNRRTLEVTLLLAAGLHRGILAGDLAMDDLAAYYPTVGGTLPHTGPGFEKTLYQTILARRQSLATFIQSTKVQTNETGRGLCWLLPLYATGWEAVHLVDLGASAGLNLVADGRAYRLVSGEPERVFIDLGHGRPIQFTTRCEGHTDTLQHLDSRSLPRPISRSGCDLSPFSLQSKSDELTLMSFIWGDQVERLERLREGILAFHRAAGSETPVRLFRADLPGDLGHFLRRQVPPSPQVPVVIYNTYMTTYLGDRGDSLQDHIAGWAAVQDRPVLWLQWEPPRDGQQPPEYGWCAWTADLWQGDTYCRWQLGWVHPHGAAAEFGPGLLGLLERWPG